MLIRKRSRATSPRRSGMWSKINLVRWTSGICTPVMFADRIDLIQIDLEESVMHIAFERLESVTNVSVIKLLSTDIKLKSTT